MNRDLLNILSNSNKEIDNQKLMDYLSGKLSSEESHAIEELMIENDFTDDALEGLLEIQDKKNLPVYVEQLNKKLREQLRKKKKKREGKELHFSGFYPALVLVLIICLIAYVIIRLYMTRSGVH